MTFKAKNGYLLIKPEGNQTERSGLIIQKEASDANSGVVVQLSEAYTTPYHCEYYTTPDDLINSRVYYGKSYASVTLDGEKYHLVQYNEIYGVEEINK